MVLPAIAPVDIMDAEGTMNLPIVRGKDLKEDVVGSHFTNYDFVINLAHFGAMRWADSAAPSRTCPSASPRPPGRSLIHSAGKATTGFGMGTPQDDFLESIAEAARGVADYMGENIVYINVMNNLSVDCDCDGNPAAPTMQASASWRRLTRLRWIKPASTWLHAWRQTART